MNRATQGGHKSPLRKSIKINDPVGATLSSNTMGRGGNGRPSSAGFQEQVNFQDDGAIALQAKITQLERDLERRQESYITRERAYKVRIDELEEELTAQRENKTGWMKSDSRIDKLKNMHSQILNNVELVQDRTARILQEQESDLLRAFRARLFDVQAELEKEKNKKDDGAAAWIERSRQLEAEVEWAKEVADRLERVNQTLLQENNRLKGQFTSQEEDRNFLIKQLVAVKKDNARLRAEFGELEKDHEKSKQQIDSLTDKLNNQVPVVTTIAKPASGNAANAILQQKLESEEKFKELNVRLRRLLAEERKSLQQVRQSYANELKIRTDMEMLLRQCVEDVRKEIARR
jgi:DNA repair exonuclease SbcCD ATPase subunit